MHAAPPALTPQKRRGCLLALGVLVVSGLPLFPHTNRTCCSALDKKADIKLNFTDGERTRIRDALLRYAAERGIGVPTLFSEISKHDPLKREFSMRTLQRFMARAHQTQDHNVSVCYEFAKELPYFSSRQHLNWLGDAMSNFTAGGASEIESAWLQGDRIELDVRYSSDMNVGEGLSLVKMDASFDDLMRYSTLVLERDDNGTFFRTSEAVHNPFPNAAPSEPIRFETEGIAVPVEDRYLLWVGRDCLTRRPRTTIWTLKPDTTIAGAYLISITPQHPEADEESRYVRSVRLDAMLRGDHAQAGDEDSGAEAS